MGFWDKAFEVTKNVGTVVAGQIEKTANELRELKLKYEGMEDEELLRTVHSEGWFSKSTREKGVAFGILKQRGYSVEEINARTDLKN